MRRTVNRELISVIATISLAVMSMSVTQPVMSLYLTSIGISASTMGLMFSLMMVGMVFGESGFGWLADKIGVRIPFGIGTVLCIPILIGFVFLTGVPFIFTLFLVWGLIRAAVFAPGRGYIGSNVPFTQKATYLAIYAASMSVSRSIGTFIGGFVGDHFGYSGSFYVAAGIALVGGLFVIIGMRKIPLINPSLPIPAAPGDGSPVLKAPYRSRVFILQCIIAVFAWFEAGLTNFLPLLAVQRTKVDVTQVGVLFTISALIGAAMTIPMGRLSDRKNKKLLMLIGMLIMAASMAGIAFSPNYSMLVVSVIVLSAGNAVFSPSAVSLVSDTVPRHWQNTAMGIYGGCEDIGVVIGSALGGVIWDKVNPGAAFLLAGTVPSLVAVLILLSLLKTRTAPVDNPIVSN
jgi:MFS family permease